MPLHDTASYIVKADTAAESLPDPTTVTSRTHLLVNGTTAAAVWSAPVGFVVDGVNAATLTIAPGDYREVYSNGVRWVALPRASRRIFAATGVTDGSGLVTFTFTPAFPSVPVVQGHPGPTATTDLTEVILTAVSTTSCTFRVRRAPSVTILGISVVTFPINAVGFTVQCVAVEAGQGV